MRGIKIVGGAAGAKALSVDQFFTYMEQQAGSEQAHELYKTVGWVHRCLNLRANALSAIPYLVYDGESAVDFRIPLNRPLWRAEADLCLFGAAYWLKRGSLVKLEDVQILNPTTMAVKTDPWKGIVAFIQSVGATTETFEPKQIVYFRLYNPTDDLGPGIPPAEPSRVPGQLAESANTWANEFFRRGAIPAVILHSEFDVTDDEIMRIRTAWNKLVQGATKAFRTLVLRRGVKPEIIGMPVKDLAMPLLMKEVRAQIAVSFGVPQTMLEDAANYATAQAHRISFYNETIIPQAKRIEDDLNRQLFGPLDLRFEFQFRQIEAVQKDEAEKAESLRALVDSGIIDPDEAREQLGYEPRIRPAPGAAPGVSAPTPEDEAKKVLRAAGGGPPPGLWSELSQWRRKAMRRQRPTPFEGDSIPHWLTALVVAAQEAVGPEEAFRFMKQMPPVRGSVERRIQQELERAFDEWATVVAGQIEAGATVDLAGLSAALRALLLREISAVTTEQLLRTATEVGIQFDPAIVNTMAADWAEQYTYDLVGGLTDATMDVVRRATRQFIETPGMTMQDLRALLEPAFGSARAEMISVTELTRAYSQAQTQYQNMAAEQGIVMRAIWRTREDERVCPICGPLEDKPEDEWELDFPDGPPAHVNCRCGLVLEYVEHKQ